MPNEPLFPRAPGALAPAPIPDPVEPEDFEAYSLRRGAQAEFDRSDPFSNFSDSFALPVARDIASVNRFDLLYGILKPVYGALRYFDPEEPAEPEERLKSPVTTKNIDDPANKTEATGPKLPDEGEIKGKGSDSFSGAMVREGLPYIAKTMALTAVTGPGSVGYGTWLALDAATDALMGFVIEDPDDPEGLMNYLISDTDELSETQRRVLNGFIEGVTNVLGEGLVAGGIGLKKALKSGEAAKLSEDLLARTANTDRMINSIARSDPENFAAYYNDQQLMELAPDLAIEKRARKFAESLQELDAKVSAAAKPAEVVELATNLKATEAKDAMNVSTLPTTTGPARRPPNLPAGVEALETILIEDMGLEKLSLSIGRDDVLKINLIEVASGKQSQGVGKAAMEEIILFADLNGLTVALTPEARGTTKGGVKRLRKFYQQFGFEPNTGPSRDLAISESMVRTPKGVSDGGS